MIVNPEGIEQGMFPQIRSGLPDRSHQNYPERIVGDPEGSQLR
jgi:hypothetical protein